MKKTFSSIAASAAVTALAISGVSVGLAAPAQATQFCQNQTLSGVNVDETIVVPAKSTCTLNNINPSASGTYATREITVGQGATVVVNGGTVNNIDAKQAASKVILKNGATAGGVTIGRGSTFDAADSDVSYVHSSDSHRLIRIYNTDISWGLRASHGGTVTTSHMRADTVDLDDMGGTTTLARTTTRSVDYTNGRANSRLEMRRSTVTGWGNSAVEVDRAYRAIFNENRVPNGGMMVNNTRLTLQISGNQVAGTLACAGNWINPTYVIKNAAIAKTGQCSGI